MDFFRGSQIHSRHRWGAKIITFRQIHNAIITLSAPEGGQTPLPTSMGVPWPDLPPGSATGRNHKCTCGMLLLWWSRRFVRRPEYSRRVFWLLDRLPLLVHRGRRPSDFPSTQRPRITYACFHSYQQRETTHKNNH